MRRFEELAAESTFMGEISLRRRVEPVTGQCVYEVKLGAEFLMSSLFTAAEEALADLALPLLQPARRHTLSVLVGGLGLGYTAVAALGHPSVGSVTVVEALQPVIDWHHQRLLPCSAELVDDERTRVVRADFFAAVAAGPCPSAFNAESHPDQSPAFDAVLLDIDHAPDQVLHPSHREFYSHQGLRAMCDFVRPGGVFALWSDKAPDGAFTELLGGVFAEVRADVVTFANPLTKGTSSNTVYLARRGAARAGMISPDREG